MHKTDSREDYIMKRFLFALSLSISTVVFSIGFFTGIRLFPALWRSLIAFFVTYAGGLIVALIFFTTYYSQVRKEEDMGKEIKEISKNEEAAVQ